VALSTFWKAAIGIGSAIGIGVVISLFSKKGMPPAPESTEPPIDEENCSRKFFPSPNQNDNPRVMPPDWIVLHDTEGGTDAANIAAYFFNPESKVSVHLVVDDEGACYRCVADDHSAWGAGAANPRALQIELVAPLGAASKWSEEDWGSHETLLEIAAAHVAHWCELYSIPTQFVNAEGLKAGQRGITTHHEVSRAFGGTHFDPGEGFPIEICSPDCGTRAKLDDFLGKVESYSGRIAAA